MARMIYPFVFSKNMRLAHGLQAAVPESCMEFIG
jgi:hypothetical protein